MSSFLKQNLPILLIIFLAFYLRFSGINPGYPEHTDEGGYSSALTMIWNKNLDPGRYDYPAGVPLLQLFLIKTIFIPLKWLIYFFNNIGPILDGFVKLPFSENEYKNIFNTQIFGVREINVMYWGRYITAIFGVGVVFMTYLLSKKLFNRAVGFIAAFLVAVNYRQVLNSHLGLPDIYNAFFLLLTLYYSTSIIQISSQKNYILAGLTNAIYFSIKFQTFGFLPIFIAHLFSFKNHKDHIKLLLSLLTSGFLMILINPYLLIKFEAFRSIQSYQLSKYGVGSNSINIFPISYLYHIGIGNIISILACLGFVYCLFKYFKKTILLAIVVLQFLIVFVYMSRGGFYTRNFVTITPLILIFSSVIIYDLFAMIKSKFFYTLFITLFVVFISSGNITNSLIVIKEYAKDWNKNILRNWVQSNIPAGSRVSAHPDSYIPDNTARLDYEQDIYFSVDEFQELNSDYAISNSSWTTNSFYWWMGGPTKEAVKYLWNKPNDVLEYSYPALALRELEQYNVFNISNPWQAPDIDFLIAKIPKYKVVSKEFYKSLNLGEWKKSGLFWSETNNLGVNDNMLSVYKESAKLPSFRWETYPIEVEGWKGFEINYKIKSNSSLNNLRSGYLFVSFYNSVYDAENSKNRLGVRLSSRVNKNNIWLEKNLIGIMPSGTRYMTVNFYSYSPVQSESFLKDVSLNKADVVVDFGKDSVSPTHMDQNNLFLNSHGNL